MTRDDQKCRIWPITLSGSQGHHQLCLSLLQLPWDSPKPDQEPGPHFNSSRALPHRDQGPGAWTVNLCPRNVTAGPVSSSPMPFPAWPQAHFHPHGGAGCLGLGLPLPSRPCCCHPGISSHPALVAPWQPLCKATSTLLWTTSWDHFPPVLLSLAFSSLEERRHQKSKLTGLLKTFSNAFCKLGGNKGVREK